MLDLDATKEKVHDHGLLPSSLQPASASRKRLLHFLKPSFLGRNGLSDPNHVVRPTDFLDGMRGYAAFAVFFCHFAIPAHPKIHTAWGGGHGNGDDHWIGQLPILRLVMSGQMCVFLFFVISGFSISLKPLKLARRGQYASLFDSLFSATFRRALRLYLPCVAALLITLFLITFGAFNFADSIRTPETWPFPGDPIEGPHIYKKNWKQWRNFIKCLLAWVDPLNRLVLPETMPYGVQLWTIPVELKCSMITWIAILGTAKCTSKVRVWTITGLAVYFHMQQHPEVPLFLAGTVLAELHLIRQEKYPKKPKETTLQKARDFTVFIIGLWLASYPRHGGRKSPFTAVLWVIAKHIVGDKGKLPLYFWTTIAATLLVWIVDRSQFLQDMFTTPVGRYLGKVSFPLYCVHMFLVNWFGYRLILFLWSTFGNDTIFTYEIGVIGGFFLMIPPCLWVGDIFMRAVDTPCVNLTRYIEQRCMAQF
ncbi:acyltransferase 3 [Lophiotrema nucula]|uniref:Acyltransferase 3 n=1 Tax=Lophiotrema nucula TaxID=690887 RepID=A0A6A5ZU30_9PLEO|nr:acyltransferase 3 [Lophiotrema nucula]